MALLDKEDKDNIREGVGIGLKAWFGILLLLMVTGAVIDASGVFWQSKIGVWRANVQRQVFEQSKAYNQGQLIDLVNYHHEWVVDQGKNDTAGMAVVASTVRAMADFDAERINDPELRAFLLTCRNK